MAYLFCYERKLTRNDGTAETPNIVAYLQGEAIRATDADYDIQYAEAVKYSYNGEITVEDIPDPETVPTQEEDTAAMLVDHEFRLTLLELGVTEA